MGRPKGSKNKVGLAAKQILEEISAEMAPVVRQKLSRMANSNDPDVVEFYIKAYIEINKFIVPKPVDITAHVTDEDFQDLYQRFQAAHDIE